ncbi:MAG: hypothetical protein GX868_00555, partial [Actinobacteria bacterium]|nr:hypothetical protein [Actinomycetota bacterium]
PVWWQGAANWTTFNTVPEFAAALQSRLTPAAPVATEGAFTDPTPFAVEPEYAAESAPSDASAASTASALGEMSTAASPLTATELIAQAGATSERDESAGSMFGTSFGEASTTEPETTRLFDATTEHAAVAVDADAAATETGATFDADPDAVAVEAEPTPEVAAPGSYLAGTEGSIDVGDDVVDAIVVDPSQSEEPSTVAPIDSPTFDSPNLEPVSLAPITLGGSIPSDDSGTAEAATAESATADLDAVYAQLVERAQPYVDEQTRVAALNDTLASLLTRALATLGHSVNSHQESNGYHVFALSDAQGAPFSLAATQVPYAASVAEAIERPIGIHVDRGGRASAYLYLGDYLDQGDAGDSLFARHLAAVIHAASR